MSKIDDKNADTNGKEDKRVFFKDPIAYNNAEIMLRSAAVTLALCAKFIKDKEVYEKMCTHVKEKMTQVAHEYAEKMNTPYPELPPGSAIKQFMDRLHGRDI